MAAAAVVSAACSHPVESRSLSHYLDDLPLPAHTMVISTRTEDPGGDVTPGVERSYRCAAASACGSQWLTALRADGWHGLGLTDAAGATSGTGSASVLPPGRQGNGIDIAWYSDGRLTAKAYSGAVTG